MEIRPFRGLRYALERLAGTPPEHLTAPPYDVIAPEEHRRLLALTPYNITRLTLGSEPGAASSYEERGRLLDAWRRSGILVEESRPSLYALSVDYAHPGGGGPRRLLALVALGKLHPFAERVVLPHEQTFEKIVADRERILEATRAHLESIFLLLDDPAGEIERTLEACAASPPAVRVDAPPGEVHALHPVSDADLIGRLGRLFTSERPVIADGHHRYTTALGFHRGAGRGVPGSGWQLMTFASLHSPGVSILGTHRLVKLRSGTPGEVLDLLEHRLERAGEGSWDLRVEALGETRPYRFPAALRAGRRGAAATACALLHDVLLGEWLRPWTGADPEIRYFKEGTGETEALRAGAGDLLLFRLPPVGRRELREVVEGGELLPHKTTFFYPKLRSGLVLWALEEP